MNIKRNEVPQLLAAHKSLQGDLEPTTRYRVARNIVHLARANRDTAAHQAALIAKYAPGATEIKQGHPEWDKYVDEFFAFLGQEVDIKLMTLSFEGLNVAVNGMSPSGIAALEPILDMTEPEPVPAPVPAPEFAEPTALAAN